MGALHTISSDCQLLYLMNIVWSLSYFLICMWWFCVNLAKHSQSPIDALILLLVIACGPHDWIKKVYFTIGLKIFLGLKKLDIWYN